MQRDKFYVYLIERNEKYLCGNLISKTFWQEVRHGSLERTKLDGVYSDLWEETKNVGLVWIDNNIHEFNKEAKEPAYGCVLPFGLFACMYIYGGTKPGSYSSSAWFEKKIVIVSQGNIDGLLEQATKEEKQSVLKKCGIYTYKKVIQLEG